jgi:hypothetical protein
MADDDFEAFWKKFLSDHPSSLNRWMHVAALVAGTTGVGRALSRRSIKPALVGFALAGAFAFVGHPLFQGDRPKNFGRPRYAARAFLRLCIRTVTGEAQRELAEMSNQSSAEP